MISYLNCGHNSYANMYLQLTACSLCHIALQRTLEYCFQGGFKVQGTLDLTVMAFLKSGFSKKGMRVKSWDGALGSGICGVGSKKIGVVA